MNQKNQKISLTILLLFGAVLLLMTVWRLLDYKSWLTSPRQVKYVLANNSQLPGGQKSQKELARCYGGDGLDYFEHHGNLWVLCRMPNSYQSKDSYRTAIYQYALIKIDPVKGRGTVYPFPKSLPIYSVIGLARGPGDKIAIVYSLHEFSQLVLGVVNSSGWEYIPTPLPKADHAKLLAVSWASGKLEVAYHPHRYDFIKEKHSRTMPVIARYENNKIATHNFPVPAKTCEITVNNKTIFGCVLHCRLMYSQNLWKFLFLKYEPGSKEAHTYQITANGEVTKKPNFSCKFTFFKHYQGALGITEPSLRYKLNKPDATLLTLDGKVLPVSRPEKADWVARTARWIIFTGHGLAHNRLWVYSVADQRYNVRRFNMEWLALAKKNRSDVILASLLDKKGNEKLSRPIFRSYLGCNSLYFDGVPIRHHKDGFWLVDQQGCYVKLSNKLQRLDGRSIFFHLKTAGSVYMDRNETRHIVKLLWILFGLPVCILTFYGIGKITGKNSLLMLNWGTVTYLLSASVLLVQLWSMLQ